MNISADIWTNLQTYRLRLLKAVYTVAVNNYKEYWKRMELNASKSVLVIRAIVALVRKIDPNFTIVTNLYNQNGIIIGIDKLKRLFGDPVPDARLADYLSYQVYRMRDAIASKRWSVSWLFSEVSIDKYKRQFMDADGKSGMMYYIDCWLDGFGINRDIIAKAMSAKKNEASKYKEADYEEPIKQRFHNTENGYVLCMTTTGWNPKSESCKTCNFTDKCMKNTKDRFPELFRLRISSN